jgi:hypothetical protein
MAREQEVETQTLREALTQTLRTLCSPVQIVRGFCALRGDNDGLRLRAVIARAPCACFLAMCA